MFRRRFAECSAVEYIREIRMFRRRFAECSAEYFIREGRLGYTYMEITSPIYDTMVSLYPNYLFEYF
jgi:hypothetical protein